MSRQDQRDEKSILKWRRRTRIQYIHGSRGRESQRSLCAGMWGNVEGPGAEGLVTTWAIVSAASVRRNQTAVWGDGEDEEQQACIVCLKYISEIQGKNRMVVVGTLGSINGFVKIERPECVWGWGMVPMTDIWKWWTEMDSLIHPINIHWAPTVCQALCCLLRTQHE